MNPSWATIADLQEAFSSGKLKAIDVVQAAFDAVESDGQELNAWTTLNREAAFEEAVAIDRRRQAGDPLGPLAGIPVGLKDMICTRGLKTTAASRMLENFIPPYDATVTSKLRESDALLVGKLNQDEFAFGSSNESSAFGPCKNPFDPTRVPGGSSGGSAAAVAAGHCTVSLGTDTGGSIRQPASFCGVFGLKPTYGRVSRYGVVAFASSLDQVGPLGRTVEDAARVFDVIGGHDPKDSTSLKTPFTSVLSALNRGITDLRIGVPKEYFSEGLDSSVEASVKAALTLMERSGATLVPISLPHTSYAVATYYVLATAEASSNLGRYDGVRYGHRTPRHVDSLESLIAKSRSEGLGDEAKRRIILGTYVLSSGYYDAYYLKAQKVRTLIKQDFEKAFTQCDIIAAATSPVSAFPLGEHVDDPLKMYLMDILTIPASLAGLPCASQPCGLNPGGLPIGLQWIAPPLQEERILQAAHFFESQTDHHRHRPQGGGR
jgi:aspartyl-tRNA(Asn)/glutamyl-tRNA(Gln) amidotransferase subunit A